MCRSWKNADDIKTFPDYCVCEDAVGNIEPLLIRGADPSRTLSVLASTPTEPRAGPSHVSVGSGALTV